MWKVAAGYIFRGEFDHYIEDGEGLQFEAIFRNVQRAQDPNGTSFVSAENARHQLLHDMFHIKLSDQQGMAGGGLRRNKASKRRGRGSRRRGL